MNKTDFLRKVRIGTKVITKGNLGDRLIYEVYEIDYIKCMCKIRSVSGWYKRGRRSYRNTAFNQIILYQDRDE